MVREQQLLHAGDRVILSGTVYTSRDAAHKRLTAAMRTDGVQALPFPLKDAVIYYTTNGDAPTTGSTQYTEAITLDATATVKAIAVLGGTTSEVASKTFTKE